MSASEVTHSPLGRGCYTRSFDGGPFGIGDYECHTGRAAKGEIQTGSTYEIVFVRRGVFVVEAAKQTFAFSSSHVLLLEPWRRYSVQHPLDGGDDCTVVTIDPHVLDEYPGGLGRQFASAAGFFPRQQLPIGGKCFLIQEKMRSAIRNGGVEQLAVGELFCDLLDEIVAGLSAFSPDPSTYDRHPEIIRRVQELVAAHYASALSLGEIGAHVGLSKYHLARVFRRVTGCSIHQFQLNIRLRAALQRLVNGEQDLTTLALDLGFVDHSHFANAFHRQFGVPPSRARQELARSPRQPGTVS